MEICGTPHPDDDRVVCDKSPHSHGAHMAWASKTVWEGLEKPTAPRDKRKRVERVDQVVSQVTGAGGLVLTGSPTTIRREAQDRAYRSWKLDRDEWLAHAKQTLREVCEQHREFTLEVVWALLPDTPERRIMAVVTKYGVRQGWMHEIGGVRINHEWRTADGATFLLGKLTPVYASDLS